LSTFIFPEHDRALSFASQALTLLDSCPDAVIQAHVLECMAAIQINLGDYPTAHVYLMQALRLCREAGDRQTESMLLNDVGYLDYRAGDAHRGLESFEQSLAIAQTDGDLDMQARMLNNIGEVLNHLERYDEAFPYLEHALTLSQQLGTRKVLANTLDGLSAVYVARDNDEQAIACLQQAYELAREFDDQRMQAEFLRNMARVYQRQAVDIALETAHRALNSAEAARSKLEIFACHQLLAELYEMRHAPEQALLHYKQFHAVKEEVFNAQSDQKLKTLRVIHETDSARQEAEIYRLKNIELQTALAKVKQLSGLLPICANCKKIRDDDGYWHDVAKYIRNHSEADFTHSMCPTCYEKLYPESFKKRATGRLTPPSDKPDATGQ
jgi:tetratricopeptide (TPR) repeat protein